MERGLVRDATTPEGERVREDHRTQLISVPRKERVGDSGGAEIAAGVENGRREKGREGVPIYTSILNLLR